MTLEQKFVEMRKAVPYLKKEKHSTAVSYKYAKLDNVWEMVVPVMNQLGVNCRIVNEAELDIAAQEIKTKNGTRLMWIYRSMVTIEWINAEDSADKATSTISAVAWNDDPAKAKGAAYTYAMKYDMFFRMAIPMGDEDPDSRDYAAESYYTPAQRVPHVTQEELEIAEQKADEKGYRGAHTVDQYLLRQGMTRSDITREVFAAMMDTFAAMPAKAAPPVEGGPVDGKPA